MANNPPAVPDPDDQRPGRPLRALGTLLIIVGVIAGLTIRYVQLDSDLKLLYYSPVPIIILGSALLYRGKQHGAQARSVAMPDDPRPPVVYLRPFSQDESGWTTVLTSVLNVKLVTGFAGFEEQLAAAVAPIGPLVTIGQPGEALPRPGATRAYASADSWQEVVENWLARARLVIVRPGLSKGVFWEIEHALDRVPRDRLVFLIRRMKRVEYDAFAAVLRMKGIELPASQRRRVSGILEFGAGNDVRMLPLRGPYWHTSPRHPEEHILHYALAPVFQRLGVPWAPRPVSAAKVMAASLMGLIVLLIGSFMVSSTLSPAGDSGTAYDFLPPDTAAEYAAPDTLSYEPGTGASEVEAVAAPGESEIGTWGDQDFGGLHLRIPALLRPTEPKLAAEAADKFESAEAWVWESDSLIIWVQILVGRPEITMSLADGVEGSIRGISQVPGITGFRSEQTSLNIAGVPAVRTAMWYSYGGAPFIMGALHVLRGQTFWMLQITAPDNAAGSARLDQVISSASLR